MVCTKRSRVNVEQRFWSKVDKSGECWLWTASKTRKGYGQFQLGGTMVSAHRLSYGWEHGDLPALLDHKCLVKHCVNPAHLQDSSSKENAENQAGPHRDSTSGIRGVSWDKRNGKWSASVGHNYKSYFVGRFVSLEEAERAVTAKRLELFTNNLSDRNQDAL